MIYLSDWWTDMDFIVHCVHHLSINESISISIHNLQCVFDILVSAALCLVILFYYWCEYLCSLLVLMSQSLLSFPHSVSPCVFLTVTPTAETHKPDEDTFGVSDWYFNLECLTDHPSIIHTTTCSRHRARVSVDPPYTLIFYWLTYNLTQND